MKQKECGIGVWDRKKKEVTLCDRKMRVQYETKGNCTFNSSLALALRYRLDRKVAGTLSDGKIGVLMSVCVFKCTVPALLLFRDTQSECRNEEE